MSTNNDREVLSVVLKSWGKRRRALEAERDRLVQRSLAAGITIEEIHQSMGIARTTIDRIGKGSQS
jgi:transposase-like protein